MLQSKLRQAIGGMEADSAQRLFGSVRGDIDFDEGVVGSDILSAFLTYACVKHWSILSLHFTSFSFAWRRAGSSRLPCHLTPPKLVPDLQIQAIDARCGIVNDLAARLLLEAPERSVDKLLRARPAGGGVRIV
jgi:hypothetical protein